MKSILHELQRFKQAEVVWCQEEPRNMGAWHFIEPFIEWALQPGGLQAQAAALCRPSGRGGHRLPA